MNEQELVHLIADVVINRLQAEGKLAMLLNKRKALVIFTGGTIGFKQSLEQLRQIEPYIEFSVLLSHAAERILGQESIKNALGEKTIYTIADGYKELRTVDMVIVPVMTQNTAAKIAHTITDSLPVTLIIQALMHGKRVICAKNAADPRDKERIALNMGNTPEGLLKVLENNVAQLANYGIELIDIANLAACVLGSAKNHAVTSLQFKEKLLAAADIQRAAMQGLNSLVILTTAVVTPLAKEAAVKYGIEIIKE